MISMNFFPNEPVPPVTKTTCSAQFMEPPQSFFLTFMRPLILRPVALNRVCQLPSNRGALHLWQPRNLKRLENRRGDVEEPHALHWLRCRCPASRQIFPLGHQENSVPVVVGAIGPRIIFLAVDFATAHDSTR